MRVEIDWLRMATLLVALAATPTLSACESDDGDEAGGVAPDLPERELPSINAPKRLDGGGEYERVYESPGDASIDGGLECCVVRFSLAVRRGDEIAVTLRGDDYPFNREEGIALVREGDAWSAEVCVPSELRGQYYYEVSIEPDEDAGSPFITDWHNPYAPTAESLLHGTVNSYVGASSCDDVDVAVHARTGPG